MVVRCPGKMHREGDWSEGTVALLGCSSGQASSALASSLQAEL